MTRLDQADGRLAEPISPRRPLPAHRAQLPLAEPLLEVAALAVLTRRLLDQLCAGLAAAGLGARRLTLARLPGRQQHRLRRDRHQPAVPRAAASSPACSPRSSPQIDPGFGIERAILAAEVVEPLLPEPLAWRSMGAGDLDQARDLAPLVDRLSNRLGAGAVSQLVPVASHLPERAQRRVPALEQARAGAALDQKVGRVRPAPAARAGAVAALAPARPARADRGDRRGARRAAGAVPLAAGGAQGRRARGPERLAPEWWREPDADPNLLTRDYFAVEDSDGGRFWLFREGLYRAGVVTLPRWYLHGLFA